VFFRHQALAQNLAEYNSRLIGVIQTKTTTRSRSASGRVRHNLVRKCSVDCLVERSHSPNNSGCKDDLISNGLIVSIFKTFFPMEKANNIYYSVFLAL
jgi:hypothetical protein